MYIFSRTRTWLWAPWRSRHSGRRRWTSPSRSSRPARWRSLASRARRPTRTSPSPRPLTPGCGRPSCWPSAPWRSSCILSTTTTRTSGVTPPKTRELWPRGSEPLFQRKKILELSFISKTAVLYQN